MASRFKDRLVSIIIPAFNVTVYIQNTIASVQAQTYPDWEMLIVDDRSRDDSFALISALSERDPRIHPLRHEVTRGPSMARNTALQMAEGRYVAFLDSDDSWLPEKLEAQLKFMQDRGAALSYTQFRRISFSGDRIGRPIPIPDRLGYQQLLKNTAIATSTVIVDRELTGPFRMAETYYDDLVLWLELLKRGFTAHGLQRDLMRYRVVPKSVSRDKWNSAQWVWRTLRQIEHLSAPHAAWCFAHYAWNGWRKYRIF